MSIAAHHGEVRCDLRHLLPGRFLLNPVPVKHSGQAIVTSNADVPIFLPLFVNVQLNNVIQQEKIGNFVVPPYDLHCPSVEPHLSKRCCSVCGLYHASVKSALSHSRDCHRTTAPSTVIAAQPEKKRPVRIAARRQREMMVVLRDHLNGETAEWVDTEEIDTDHLENESSNSKQGATAVPVIDNIEQWTNTPWQDI